jgi:glycosyltransferase involved in cell wall biosynthesis
MKLCLPNLEAERGGSGTFRRLWRAWLTQQGLPWTEDLQGDYDLLFVNAWQVPYRVVYQAKRARPGLRVIHRIDGAGRDYGRTDGADAIQQSVNTLADLTIFQSDYSRHSTRRYGLISVDGGIIYNPVDTQHYHPPAHRAPLAGRRPRILTAIWSPNRRKGAWRIPLLARAHPGVDFYFAGQAQFEDTPPNLHSQPPLDHNGLAELMRSVDLFMNLSENDPCPNIVLEALASGLPVLYHPSGGTPELVGEEGGRPFSDEASFGAQLDSLLAALPRHQAAARARAQQKFDQGLIFPQYWQAIQKTERRPWPPRWRHYVSYGQRARVWLRDKVVNYGDWLPYGR